MKEAEEAGLIKSETRQYGKHEQVVWTLTELGKDMLRAKKSPALRAGLSLAWEGLNSP